ncbi:transposase family protein [Vibrio coralliilyticus]|uniref:Transposase family protein n=1 Tax=Vibrio coralliilyticus TaxID=190893 RepID=A0AAP7DE94_9VIBR|nr:transposase family protein [Vibrio coralliilyticus]
MHQRYGIRARTGNVGACWNNAVVERSLGNLKHISRGKISQST